MIGRKPRLPPRHPSSGRHRRRLGRKPVGPQPGQSRDHRRRPRLGIGNLPEHRLPAGGEWRRLANGPISEDRIRRSGRTRPIILREPSIDRSDAIERRIDIRTTPERRQHDRLSDEDVGLIGGHHRGTAIRVERPTQIRSVTAGGMKMPIANRHEPRGPQACRGIAWSNRCRRVRGNHRRVCPRHGGRCEAGNEADATNSRVWNKAA